MYYKEFVLSCVNLSLNDSIHGFEEALFFKLLISTFALELLY